METLADRLATLANRYGLRDIYVFGSRAEELGARLRGEAGDGADSSSDVDIAVQPGAGIDLSARDRVRIAAELEDLLELPRVDLVVLPEASPFLALDVVRGILLYSADSLAQAEQELYIMRRAGDLLPLQRARVREVISDGAR